ncbi:plasmid pRiA4b ORF-3 family protein [Sphingomonas oligophenolica]|uniref:Plasmid pRiA4b ORF-3 family protein n=1 Tax=Sphingomonas oligophenolica TaxID=301154 RepID=A0ABU9Y2D3_9SPHN
MSETIARLRIALSDSDPEIWRTVDVPLGANLRMLHDIVQAAMGWQDHHLWEFEVAGRRYGRPDPHWRDGNLFAASNIRLKALVDRGVGQFGYTYDMGDDWHHDIAIERVEPGQPGTEYPRYVGGARRCPPEDVGGIPGFENFLDAIANADHPEHQDMTDWHFAGYRTAFDPDLVDELAARRRIGTIVKRRAAGKAAYAKQQSG